MTSDWSWLISLNSLIYIHLFSKKRAWFCFNGWILCHCVSIPHFIYPFTCWQTPTLFPCYSFCEFHTMLTNSFENMPRTSTVRTNAAVFLALWGNSILFFTVALLIQKEPKVPLSCIFTHIYGSCVLYKSHSNGDEIKSPLLPNGNLSIVNEVQRSFHI